MAGLFSGASLAPGNEAMGQAVGNLADILYKKLDEAEAVSQYHTGQQILSNMMNKFDLSLDQDPNWNGYEEKNNQSQEQAWQTAQSQMKNQTARKELTNWWESEKLSRSRVITNKIVNARLNENQGRLKVLVDDTVNNSGMTADQKKARLTEVIGAAVKTNVADKFGAEATLQQKFKIIDQNDLVSGGLNIMGKEGGGEQAGMAWMLDPKNVPALNSIERDRLAKTANEMFKTTQAIQDGQAEDKNGEVLMKLQDKIDTGKIDAKDPFGEIKAKDLAGRGKIKDAALKDAYARVRSYVEFQRTVHGGYDDSPGYMAAAKFAKDNITDFDAINTKLNSFEQTGLLTKQKADQIREKVANGEFANSSSKTMYPAITQAYDLASDPHTTSKILFDFLSKSVISGALSPQEAKTIQFDLGRIRAANAHQDVQTIMDGSKPTGGKNPLYSLADAQKAKDSYLETVSNNKDLSAADKTKIAQDTKNLFATKNFVTAIEDNFRWNGMLAYGAPNKEDIASFVQEISLVQGSHIFETDKQGKIVSPVGNAVFDSASKAMVDLAVRDLRLDPDKSNIEPVIGISKNILLLENGKEAYQFKWDRVAGRMVLLKKSGGIWTRAKIY